MAENKKISKIKLPDGTVYDIKDPNSSSAIVFDGVYDETTNKAATVQTVTDKIDTLDGIISGSAGVGKTLSAFSQTDGKVSATFNDISITKSQISDFPTLGTAASLDSTTSVSSGGEGLPTSGAVYTAIGDAIAASDAMIYKGTLGTGGTISSLPTIYKIGWTYRVITAGSYAGVDCEIGDLIIALVNRSGSGNQNSDWTVAQSNIDGAIVKSGTTTSGYLAKFSGSNSITNGPELGSDTTKFLRNDGSWEIPPDSAKSVVTAAGDIIYASGANTLTRLAGNTGDTTKYLSMTSSTPSWKSFSGGSFTRGSFSGGSFTQGSDSFTPASLSSGFYTAGTKGTPTTIDTSKFNGGSFESGTFSQGSLPSLTYTSGTMTLNFNAGTLPSHGSDSFTAASLASGFYTVGSSTTPATIDTSKFNGGSFTQGTDSFTPATHANDSFTAADFS